MENYDFTSIESEGKSVDEAIFKGLQRMGISIDEVSIEILRTETKGFLGIGAKPAKVRLSKKQPEGLNIAELMRAKPERTEQKNGKKNRPERQKDEEEAPAKPEKSEKPAKAEKAPKQEKPVAQEKNDRPAKAEKAEKPSVQEKPVKPEKTEKKEDAPRVKQENEPEKAEKPEKTEKPERAEKLPRPEKPAKQKQDKPKPQRKPEKRTEAVADENAEAPAEKPAEAKEEPAKVINYTLEAAEGNPAAEFVKGLIEHMGTTGQVLAAMDEDCLRLRIDSEMMGMLIGHRGETLDAMQYLTGLVINKNRKTEGYTRVTLNTEEYREKREETLRHLAKKVAAQVRATGRPRVLEPMNPYERRVLHSTLQNNPDVTTHSEGEEPNRRVVVTPKRARGKAGYSKGRGGRRNAERRPTAAVEEDNSDDGTISQEEYRRLYEAARAASPMFMNRPASQE